MCTCVTCLSGEWLVKTKNTQCLFCKQCFVKHKKTRYFSLFFCTIQKHLFQEGKKTQIPADIGKAITVFILNAYRTLTVEQLLVITLAAN